MRYFILLFLAAVVLVSNGCSQPQPVPDVSSVPVDTSPVTTIPVNTICPIMGGEVMPEGGSAIWKGTTVGFCCEGCAPKWEKLSEEDKAAKLTAANTPAEQGSGEHDHSDHDHSAHEH